MLSQSIVLTLLPILTSAHFQLEWPESRGFDENDIVNYPCGGFDDVSDERTPFPTSGGPLQLSLEHTRTNFEVLIAMGNDPSGDDFHTVLVPTFFEQGPEDFCIGALTRFPDSLNVTEGMNATLMVQANGDPNGGLYQCADITFTSDALSESDYSDHCQNSTNIRVSALNTDAHANETEAGRAPSGSDSSDSTSDGAATSPTDTPGIGPRPTAGVLGAGLGALAVAGLAVL